MDAFVDWATIVAASVLGGLAILWTIGGFYHLRYYVLRRHEPERWKCQPKRFLSPKMQRQAVLLSHLNLTIGGILSGTYIHAILHGFPTPMYFDVADYGWAYTLASTLVLFVLVDFVAYWAHRILHAKVWFRYIHRWHHRFVAPTPWVVTAMHPVEFVFFQVTAFLPLFVLPVHWMSAVFVFVYALVFNVIDHSGVRLHSRWPWQGPTTYHDDHHVHFHVNFGQHLMLWDRLYGTLRRVDRRYGEQVFGGKGEGGSTSGAPRYFDYSKR